MKKVIFLMLSIIIGCTVREPRKRTKMPNPNKVVYIKNEISCLSEKDIKQIKKKGEWGWALKILLEGIDGTAPYFDTVQCVGLIKFERRNGSSTVGRFKLALKSSSKLYFATRDTTENKKKLEMFFNSIDNVFTEDEKQEISELFIRGSIYYGHAH